MVSRARQLSLALSPSKDVDGVISLGPIKVATTLTKSFSQNESWSNSTYNNEHAALRQALSISINRMNSTQLSYLSDLNEPTLGSTLDLMIAPYVSSSNASPISDGVTINYDSEALIRYGIPGTDYNVEFPSTTKVKITSLSAHNLRIKVL